jgi:hypothetical protein
MAAKVLKLDNGTKGKKEPSRKVSHYSEDPKARYLLMGTDAQGKPIYFFKMQITSLKDRLFGPYKSRSMAVTGFDTVLGAAREAFVDVQNLAGENVEHIAIPIISSRCRWGEP